MEPLSAAFYPTYFVNPCRIEFGVCVTQPSSICEKKNRANMSEKWKKGDPLASFCVSFLKSILFLANTNERKLLGLFPLFLWNLVWENFHAYFKCTSGKNHHGLECWRRHCLDIRCRIWNKTNNSQLLLKVKVCETMAHYSNTPGYLSGGIPDLEVAKNMVDSFYHAKKFRPLELLKLGQHNPFFANFLQSSSFQKQHLDYCFVRWIYRFREAKWLACSIQIVWINRFWGWMALQAPYYFNWLN